ncbi:MAG: hypothetical protein ACE5IK_15040 [Acidobacteriota bacterium]
MVRDGFIEAARAGDVARAGAHVESRTRDGKTALAIAAEGARCQARAEASGGDGPTDGLRRNYEGVIRLLTEAGARAN